MIYILPDHERAAIFTMGRFSGVKGPGLVFVIPGLQTMTRVDLRSTLIDTRSAKVTYRITDPAKALLQVADYRDAIEQLVQPTVDSVMQGRASDALVFDYETIGNEVRANMNATVHRWGITVEKVSMK